MSNWRIAWVVFLRTTLRAPWALIAGLGGVAAGTAVLLALSLANDRAVRAFESATRSLSESSVLGQWPGFENREYRRSGSRVSEAALHACQTLTDQGVLCRGVSTEVKEVLIPGKDPIAYQRLAVRGGLEELALPAISQSLLNVLGVENLDRLPPEARAPFQVLPIQDPWLVVAWAALPPEEQRGFDWLEVSYPKASSPEKLESLWMSSVPAGEVLRSTRSEGRLNELTSMTESYRFNLRVLGWMSILVGGLLISNVATLALLLRRYQVSVLLQLGATRRRILAWILGEQLLLGMIGAALGCWLGLVLEGWMSQQVLGTLSRIYLQDAASFSLASKKMIFAAWLAGTTLFMLASIAATRDLMRVPPAQLRRRGSVQNLKRSRWIGRVFSILAVVIIAISPWGNRFGLGVFGISALPGYLAATAVFALILLWVPSWIYRVSSAVARLLSGERASRMPELALASRRLSRSGVRGQAQLATLVAGITLVVGLIVMVGGFRRSLTDWLAVSFHAEWMGEPTALLRPEDRKPRASEKQLEQLRSNPQIQGVDCILIGDFDFRGRIVRVAGIDDALSEDRLLPMVPVALLPGLSPRDTLLKLRGDPTSIVVSEVFANRFGIMLGQELELDLARLGRLSRYRVIAIAREYSSDLGYVLIDRREYTRLSGVDGCSNLRIYTKTRPADIPGVRLFSGTELRKIAVKTFDETFAVTWILTGLAAFLGALSLITQQAQSVVERQQDWWTLKVIGTSSSGLGRAIRAEIGLLVFSGVSLGIFFGAVLGWVLCFAINRQAFGWVIAYGSPEAWIQVAGVALGYFLIVASLTSWISSAWLRQLIRLDRLRRTRE